MKFFLDNLFLSCDEGLDLGGGEFAWADKLLHDVVEFVFNLLGDGVIPRQRLFDANAHATLVMTVIQAIERDVGMLFLQIGNAPLKQRITIHIVIRRAVIQRVMKKDKKKKKVKKE